MNKEETTNNKSKSQRAVRSVRTAIEKTVRQARRAGAQIGRKIVEGGELVQLTRTGRAIRAEVEGHYRAIGRRAFLLHKRARGQSPFGRFKMILNRLETLEGLEKEYQAARFRLNQVRRELRGKSG